MNSCLMFYYLFSSAFLTRTNLAQSCYPGWLMLTIRSWGRSSGGQRHGGLEGRRVLRTFAGTADTRGK